MVSGIVLYMFRGIYAEVVTALPVNGGTYTVLLNTTAKSIASLAACLTMLSYVSTAVVSASVAITYLQDIIPSIATSWGTIILLAIFAVLNLFGIKDSANVAVCIFAVHMTIMVILVIDCAIFAFQDGFSLFGENFEHRDDNFFNYTTDSVLNTGVMTIYPLGKALVFGFSSAMLGITGFETSANYVEEQRPGVFVKTLRNMWYCVAILNPAISFLSLCVLPLSQVRGYPLSDGSPSNANLLKSMARQLWLKKLVSLDAFMVLAGSVLTAYVGVTGLVRRMAFDRCLPSLILQQNKTFGTNHIIIIGFFLVCTSMFFITNQNVLILASVYTISFLSVMSLFAIGNLILKYKRSRIRREHRARVPVVLLSLVATITAIYGNIVINGSTIQYFFLYYGCTLLIVGIMFQRVHILRMIVRGLVRKGREGEEIELPMDSSDTSLRNKLAMTAIKWLRQVQEQKIIFFIKDADIRLMNKAIEYVRDNEQTQILQFVHVHVISVNDPASDRASLSEHVTVKAMMEDLTTLQRVYPKMKLDFAAISSHAQFKGSLVKKIGERLGVPTHFMFISCPSEKFSYDIAQLGGVRLITGAL
jgi:amino acid transporter